jgi:hypothetical protein
VRVYYCQIGFISTHRKIGHSPLYHFISEALSGAKKFYSELEKMTYVVVMAARKLNHYFQSYSITVPTSYPLREIQENKESLVRIGKWASEIPICHRTHS